MNIAALRKQPHLSASSINEYLECGLSYRFRCIDQIEFEHTSDSLLLGSAIHRTIEDFYIGKKNNAPLTLEDLHQRFEEHWKACVEDSPTVLFKDGRDYQSCLSEGKELITVYYNNLPSDNFQVLATEMAFSMDVEGVPIPVIGVIDLLLLDEAGCVVIVDHKTASRAYSKDDIDKSLQLTLYHMAAKRFGYEGDEILLRFDTLVKTKTPKFLQYYTVRTELDEQRTVRKIQQVWNAIESGVFMPNDSSWKCGYCAFKNHCDNWFSQ